MMRLSFVIKLSKTAFLLRAFIITSSDGVSLEDWGQEQDDSESVSHLETVKHGWFSGKVVNMTAK